MSKLYLISWPTYSFGLLGDDWLPAESREPPIWHSVWARIRGPLDEIWELIRSFKFAQSASSWASNRYQFFWKCFGVVESLCDFVLF